jgi:hypothetical protein
MHKELLLDFGELGVLVLSCPKCKTKVQLDCTDHEAHIPDECPGCSAGYDPSFRSTLLTYRQVYQKLADPQGRQVEVRVAVKPEAE